MSRSGFTGREWAGAQGQGPSDFLQRAAAAYNAGRLDEAARTARAGLAAGSREPVLLHLLGASLVRLGRLDIGIDALRQAIQTGLQTPEVWCDLANGLRASDDIQGAHESLDRALTIRAHHPAAVRGKVTLLHAEGRQDEAVALLDSAMTAEPADISLLLAFGTVARSVGRGTEAIDRLAAMLATGGVPNMLVRAVHVELARLLDAESRFDEAFEHARLAAVAAGPVPPQDDFESTISQWSADRFAAISASPVVDPLPILIVGMPRSGTSLAEQMLAAHPDIGGIGESPALPRLEQRVRGAGWSQESIGAAGAEYLAMLRSRAPGKARVADKLPGNYTILGPIVKMLPGARIVHCVRDARDTCLSCHFQNFGQGHTYARDLATLGGKYVAYERLMAHWRDTLGIRMFELRYETLVHDFEKTSRALVEFVGMPWSDRVLRFHELKRHMRTASAGQVHRPLFTSSIGRWKHYERHLGPLISALGHRDP